MLGTFLSIYKFIDQKHFVSIFDSQIIEIMIIYI